MGLASDPAYAAYYPNYTGGLVDIHANKVHYNNLNITDSLNTCGSQSHNNIISLSNNRVFHCVAPYDKYIWLGHSSRDM